MAVESHPLRITERDVIKEQSLDEWFNSFKGLDLHIRVLHARDLSPTAGLPDPYCKVLCGPATHQTATQRRTLDPVWGEDFYLEWGELSAGKRFITLEAWDWDFWRPDELLGRGFICLNDLAFEPLEVQKLVIKLYPPSVRRPQDIKPAKQHKPPKKQPSKQQQQKQKQKQAQSQPAATAPQAEQEQQQQGPQVLSTLHSTPSFRYLLQSTQQQQQQQVQEPAESGADSTNGSQRQASPPAKQQQQQQQQQQQSKPKGEDSKQDSGSSGKDAPAVELGSITVALWWAPSRRSTGFDVAERVSFCLLPGEVKAPPVVMHSKLGTLYEEPCVVYFKLSLLEVHLGGSWYLEYLGQTHKASKQKAKTSTKGPSPLQRTTSSSSSLMTTDLGDGSSAWDGFPAQTVGSGSPELLERSESLEAALVAVSGSKTLHNRRRQLARSQHSTSSSTSVSALQDRGEAGFWGDFDSPTAAAAGVSSSLFNLLPLLGDGEVDGEEQLTPSEVLRRQQRQQQLLQQHLAAEPVFALARLQFGKQQVAESIPVRLRPGGAAVFREQFVFATKRPLQNKRLVMEVVLRGKGLPGGKLVARRDWSVVELLMASPPPPTTWLGVQALKRCQVPGVLLPLQGIEGSCVELIAAAADADGRAAMYGVPPLGLEATVAAGLSRAGSTSSTPRWGNTPRASMDMGSWQQQQQQEQPWLARVLSKQVGWRRTAGSSAPSSPRHHSAPASRRHSNLSRSPFASDPAAATAAVAAIAAAAAAESCVAHSTAGVPSVVVSALSGGTSGDVADAAAAAAAAAAAGTVAAVEAATVAAAAAAAPGGDVAVPDELSPIPGLPVRPEPGGLLGPLATLQLVIHRVELVPEPSKGWWVVVKVGPHWARSNIRREADFAWQLSVPIFHPTTTLVMVVYGEAGRGKITFLGKLHYRISYLMYLNHREVVKSLKLRTNSSSSSSQQSTQPGVNPDGTPATNSNVSGVVLLSFTCAIPDRTRLMKAYERSPYPPMVHQISLFHAAKRDDILQAHHRKVVAWLSTVADPPIPPVVAWKVLETGRESFKLSRSRHNIQRLKVATGWIPAAWGYFTELKAWVRPVHNIISVVVMACICFFPRFSLFAFLLWRSVVALRRLLMHSFVEYLGVDLGELFDSAGLLPSDFLYDEGDEDDEAASTTSSSSTTSSAWGGGGASGSSPGQAGSGGWGSAGGVRDSAAVMMFQPRRLQRLKRRYEQLLRISLQVQNRIDDIAMSFERLHAMVTGQDPLATALFFWRCLLLATALWLLGPGPLLFVWWCWEVLRPPSWRKPPGVKGPLQFVINLPSRSLEEG